MRHISLFSGIGGFDLASEWMGWENVAHCEWNPFCQKILKYYWPKAESYSDITKTCFKKYHGTIDIISGGFPCQPFSVAGQRQGTEDNRYLWPSMLRVIREVSPTWVVGENVLGLVNWSEGMVFEQVYSDLEAEGYKVQAFVLPACGVDAPHKRDRVWFVAYRNSARFQKKRTEFKATGAIQCGELGFKLTPEPNHQRSGNGLREVSETDGEISEWNEDAEFGNANKWPSQNTHRNGWDGYQWQEEPKKWGFGNTGARDNVRVQTDDDEAWDAANSSSQSGEWLRPKQRKISKSKSWEFRRIDCKDGGFQYAADAPSFRQPRRRTRGSEIKIQ